MKKSARRQSSSATWDPKKGFTKKEGRPRKLSEKDARKLAKWKESVWKLLVYGGLCLYGFYVVHDEPFFWDSEEFWSGNACPSTCQSWPSCSRVHFDSEIKLYCECSRGVLPRRGPRSAREGTGTDWR